MGAKGWSMILAFLPLRSSSLWMAMADTHLLSPPSGAAVTDSSAIRSVAPWSVWKAKRDALMLFRLPFLSAPFCFVPAASDWSGVQLQSHCSNAATCHATSTGSPHGWAKVLGLCVHAASISSRTDNQTRPIVQLLTKQWCYLHKTHTVKAGSCAAWQQSAS